MPLPNTGMSFTPFDPLPAGDLNDLVENIEALADGSGLNTDAVNPTKWTNPYAFSAHCSGTFTASAGNFVVIPFDTEDADYNSNYDTTNKRYTAPIAGLYNFSISCALPSTGGATRWGLALYVNAAEGRRFLLYTFPTESLTVGNIAGSGDLILAANDLVDARLYCSGSASGTGGTSAVRTAFAGHLVSPQ